MKLYTSHLILLSIFTVHGLPHKNPVLTGKSELDHFRLALDAVFGMGIRLQAFLQQEKDENFLVCPISATVVIGQLLLGAEGEFREQLVELLSLPDSHLYANDKIHHYGKDKNMTYSLPYSTLHIQLSNLLKALEGGVDDKQHFILKQKSAVFLNNRLTLKNQFERNLRQFYYANLYPLNFIDGAVESQKFINEWASKSTNGLINSVLPEPPNSDTASIFANAVYFVGEWQTPFSDEINRVGNFSVTESKQVQVTFMAEILNDIPYAKSEDYRMIALPYKNEELGMYILLPNDNSEFKYDMKNFVQKLKYSEILETIAEMKRRQVTVVIPKMTLSNSFSILEQLKKYRLFKMQENESRITNATNVVDKLEDKVDAFNNFTANIDKDIFLTNAIENGNLRIDDVVQQVIISINEKGTEAAAVTMSTTDKFGSAVNFRLDRPFVFFIRHEATSASLFWGTISNPVA